MTATTIETSQPSTGNLWQRIGTWLLRPSSSIQTPEGRRQAQLMSSLTLTTFLLTTVRVIVGFRSGSYLEDEGFYLYYLLQASMLASYVFSRTKYLIISTLLFVLSFTGLVYGIVIVRGSTDPLENLNTLIWVLPGFIFGAALFSYWVSFLWMASNFVFILILPQLYPAMDSSPLTGLLFTIFVLTALTMVLNRYREQVEKDRQAIILKTNRELQTLNASLEERVSARTRALETSTEVSRRLSTILDPNQLVLEVVEQVKSVFKYYHVHIYLLDESRQSLNMVGGTGEAGREMLANKHSIPLERGLVGRAARTKTPVLIPDTAAEPGWLPNPLLPETKAEIAVPIIFRDTVIGVLDVQHNILNGLTEADQDLLQSIANQVAIAVQNAQQFEQVQQSAKQLQETSSFMDSVIENLPTMLFVKEAEDLRFVRWNKAGEDLVGFTREDMIGKNDYDFFAQKDAEFFSSKDREVLNSGAMLDIPEEPIHTQHRGLRWLHTRKIPIFGADGKPKYLLGISEDITDNKQTAEILAKRSESDRVLARIATKIRGAVTMDQVLQVAAQEVRQATGAARSVVKIEPNEETVTLQTMPLREL